MNEKAWTLGTDNPDRFLNCDYNYIFHPYVDNHIIYQRWDKTTFADWQIMTGHDAHSKTNWFTRNLTDPPISRIFWNATQSTTTINLGARIYYDLDRKQVAGSLILQPYRSKILIETDRRIFLPFVLLLMD